MVRRALSWYFEDPNILLSQYITESTRILFHRNIQNRVRLIAPFLRLDQDPYLVISEGRLYWMQDAYTTSNWFPSAAPPVANGTINYIRNSVKVVIDAYNGVIDFTWSIRRNRWRRPTSAYSQACSNRSRRCGWICENTSAIRKTSFGCKHKFIARITWRSPKFSTIGKISGNFRANQLVLMAPMLPEMSPYYIIMRLPGEKRAEFFLLLPMVPSQRQNMIAWLAARCDPPDYGKLIVYQFPKDKLVYGPSQIEARIHQNTEISQQYLAVEPDGIDGHPTATWHRMCQRVIVGERITMRGRPHANYHDRHRSRQERLSGSLRRRSRQGRHCSGNCGAAV